MIKTLCPDCGTEMNFIQETHNGDQEYQCPDCGKIEVY